MPSKKKKSSAASSGDGNLQNLNSGEIKNMEDDKEPLNGVDHASHRKEEKRKKRKKGSDDGLGGDDNGSTDTKTLKVKIKLGDSETTTQAVDDLEPEKKKKKTKSKKSEPPKDLVVVLDEIIEKLFKADKKQIFWYPVQDEIYLKTINNPMDLSTLKSNLLQGKYDTVARFKADLELIYQNAETYNGAGSPIHKQAEKLRAISSKELSSFSNDDKIITPLTSDTSSAEECMTQILDILKFEDSYSIFHEPVPLTVPGYHELIKKPMDFATLRKKVIEKHISISKFEKYLNRVFANATKFNLPGSIYHNEAVRIGEFAKGLTQQMKTKFSKGGSKAAPKITIKISDQNEEPKEKKSKKKKKEEKEEQSEETKDKKPKKKKKEKKAVAKEDNEEKNGLEQQAEEASANVESSETTDITTPKKSSDKKKTPKSKPSTKWRDRVRITDLDFPELEKDSLYSLINLIWNKLNDIDEYSIFKTPVGKDVPGYHETIKEPMDLSTMKGKIDAKSYENWRDFEDDVDRIYDNCKLFNSQDSIFSKEANRQQRWFRKWKKDMVTHFGKHQKSDLTPTFVANYFNEISVVKTGAPKYDLSALNEEEESEEETTTLPRNSLCYHLLKIAEELKAQDKSKYFWNNVDESIHPNYKEKVKHPMSLSTIIDNCKNVHYKTIDQFVNDFDLLHSNTVNYFTSSSKEAKESKRLFNLSKDKVQPLRSKTFKDVSSTSAAQQPKSNKRETRASSSAADIDSFMEPETPSKPSDKKKKPSQTSQPKPSKKKKALPPTNPYSKDIDLGWVPMIQPCAYWQFPTYTPDPNPENRPKSIESNHDATQSFIDPSSLSSSYSRDDESVSSNDEETPRKDKKKEKAQAKAAVDAVPTTFKTPKTSKKEKAVTIAQTPVITTPSSFTPALLSPSIVQPLSNKTVIPNIVIENRPLPKHAYLVKKFRQRINFRTPTYDWKALQNMSLGDCLKLFSDEDRTLEEIVQCYKKQPDIIPTHNLSYGMKDFKDINEEDDDLIQRLITIATKNSDKHHAQSHRDSDEMDSISPKPGRKSSLHRVKDYIDEDEEEEDMDEDEEDEELSDMEELYDDEGKKEKHVDEMEDDEEDEEISENDVLEHVLQDFETVTVPSTRRSNPEEMFKKVKQTLIDEGVNILVEDE
ncbi:hypothetical protein C9374_000668 [Naegleria lovaniensis]|uniref:Bromo domain-containing protein n=1 Tax=Naegleria lovaniensis TaxID=51637 RepID=A0AA88GZF6_NAELO|nr:uncharacterized protein C9374_000668 [Naegleria lovaniensis]KAG2388504.1 hypothetical protein C9374_000668 [Naegleria lovaniensis]